MATLTPVQPFLAAIRDFAGLKTALGVILGIVIIFAFLATVVLVIYSALKREQEPDKAKQALITAGWVSLGWTFCSIIFVAAGMGEAVVDVLFK